MGMTKSFPLHCTKKSPLSNTVGNNMDSTKKYERKLSSLNQCPPALNERQVSVLMKMNMEATKLSAASEKELLNKLSKEKLNKVALHIQYYCDIIIHFFLDKLIEAFLTDQDGRYKNLFETGRGNGSNCKITRARWEDRLFFDGYSNAEAYERVKYGCLNVAQDVCGVASAYQYGDSFFILNNDTVRSRATLSDGDTANPKRAVGTFSACHHVIERFSNDELNSIYRLINPNDSLNSMTDDSPKTGESDKEDEMGEIFTMKEVQIHGNLRFQEDIKTLVISKRHTDSIIGACSNRPNNSDPSLSGDQSLLEKTKKFCELYDIELKLQD